MDKKSVAAIIEFDVNGIADEMAEIDKLSYELGEKVNSLSRKLRTLRIVEASTEKSEDTSEWLFIAFNNGFFEFI